MFDVRETSTVSDPIRTPFITTVNRAGPSADGVWARAGAVVTVVTPRTATLR
jgi:hypothetical protein